MPGMQRKQTVVKAKLNEENEEPKEKIKFDIFNDQDDEGPTQQKKVNLDNVKFTPLHFLYTLFHLKIKHVFNIGRQLCKTNGC
jgi:hypothetical protein